MKKSLMKIASFAYFFAAFFVMFSNNAHAYIDPSATTFLVQALAAVAVAIGAAFTVFRHKVTAFFRKGSSSADKREVNMTEDFDDDDEDLFDDEPSDKKKAKKEAKEEVVSAVVTKGAAVSGATVSDAALLKALEMLEKEIDRKNQEIDRLNEKLDKAYEEINSLKK